MPMPLPDSEKVNAKPA